MFESGRVRDVNHFIFFCSAVQRLLEDLRKVNRKQEEHIQDYLAKINREFYHYFIKKKEKG